MSQPKRHLSAREAAAELGVSVPTLYAYVSRGLLRSEAGGDRRAKRYHWDDIARLKARKEQRRDPSAVATGALHAGMPVLDSALTLITEDGLYYRGMDVRELVGKRDFEAVAAWLWQGDFAAVPVLADSPFIDEEVCRAIFSAVPQMRLVERMQMALPVAASTDVAGYDLRPTAVVQCGGRILRLMVRMATGGPLPPKAGIAAALQAAWAPRKKAARRLLEAALILCADHELNASTFTARCVASTGATPYAVVAAGLAALQGPKHGGSAERLEAVLAEIKKPGDAPGVVARRVRLGEPVPGFGHVIYRGTDPRGELLLTLVEAAFPRHAAVARARALIDAVEEINGEPYNVDLALLTLCNALGLGSEAAMTLFALGRTAGWIGHALEEYAQNRLIRPRARYTGRQPDGPA